MFLCCLDDGREVEPAKALELLGLSCDAIQLAQHFVQESLPFLLTEVRFLGVVASLGKQALAALALLAVLLVL